MTSLPQQSTRMVVVPEIVHQIEAHGCASRRQHAGGKAVLVVGKQQHARATRLDGGRQGDDVFGYHLAHRVTKRQ